MDYGKFIEKRLIKLASIPTSCSPAPEYSLIILPQEFENTMLKFDFVITSSKIHSALRALFKIILFYRKAVKF